VLPARARAESRRLHLSAANQALVGRPSDASLADLRDALDDSALPWLVDVCLLDDFPDELRRLISDHGVAVRLPATA
jgi:hypothetical protein